MSGKISSSIYKIDLSILDIHFASTEKKNFKSYIKKIRNVNEYDTGWNEEYIEKMNIGILFRHESMEVSWGDFFKKTLDDQHVLNVGKVSRISFILFFEEGDCIYALTAGVGFHVIKKFIHDDFGVEIFCRIFEKLDIEPSFLKFRGFLGKELMGMSYFRENYKLVHEDDFGKVYSEVASKIKKSDMNKFFPSANLALKTDITLEAKDSIAIRKSLSLSEFRKMCTDLNNLMSIGKKFSLNRIRRLDKGNKKDHAIIELLKKKIDEVVWECLKFKKDYPFELISPKHSIEYLNANFFEIVLPTKRVSFSTKLDGLIDFPHLVSEFREHLDDNELSDESKSATVELFLNSKIEFGEEGKDFYYSDIVSDLLSGEIILGSGKDSKKYFRIDKYWYEFEDDFESYVNKEFQQSVLKKVSKKVAVKKWPRKDIEEVYIAKHFNHEDGWIPMHTMKIQNIEICDILRIDKDEKKIYLVHVKDGIDAIMRDVVSQAVISTRMLIGDRNANKDIIKSYIDSIKKKKGKKKFTPASTYNEKLVNQCNDVDLSELEEALAKYGIVTCICLRDPSKKEKDLIKDYIEINSNIAKLSLINFCKTMASMNEECIIYQAKCD